MIVLDLGQEVSNATTSSTSSTTTMTSTPSNNVLSDILQMTGIMSEDEAAEQSETVQLQPRLETKTLKKGVFLSAKGEYFYIKITYCSKFFYNQNLRNLMQILEYL